MNSFSNIFAIYRIWFQILVFTSICCCTLASAQTAGKLQGKVTLDTNGQPIHQATVMIVENGRVAETDAEGRFALEGIAPGSYSVVAFAANLSTAAQLVEIRAGETQELDFQLKLSPLRHEITVTARGKQETAFEAVQSVTSLDAFELANRQATSLGEVLDGQPGVAKRSFGPGSARPVVRGFDGDRVLVMQDGVRVGSLASQSGDHGEPIDASNLDRIEILKGPATLLYGSNAVGGVVNAVSGHHEIHTRAHQGLRGQISSVAGSNNGHLGSSFSVEYGRGQMLFWIGGGGQRAGDYDTPLGAIADSKSRISNASGGFGWYGDKGFATIDYGFNDGRYGIPFAQELGGGGEEAQEPEAVEVGFRSHKIRFSGGLRNLKGALRSFRLSLNYADWAHDELEIFPTGIQEVGTAFRNQQFIYRGVFEHSQGGALSGSFGFWGLKRDYDVAGEEALSPPVDQTSLAVFALEELQLEGVKLHFGGRLEHTRFDPRGSQLRQRGEPGLEPPSIQLPERGFTGMSAGIGARFDLWQGGAFVANFVTSQRAPALEELYNFGPHLGNLAFEIGNPLLESERSNGFDFSLRHQGSRVRAQANFFYYGIDNFVFAAPTGEIEDGLFEAEFRQGDSRFTGTELTLNLGIRESVWINFGLDAVDAELTGSGQSLPRIPPLRARLGLDLRCKGFSLRPELVAAQDRSDIFSSETPTAGYGVVNLKASYTLGQQHFIHHFSLNLFNLGDQLYRNHLSFIKDLAPEIGRGVRFSYVVNFF